MKKVLCSFAVLGFCFGAEAELTAEGYKKFREESAHANHFVNDYNLYAGQVHAKAIHPLMQRFCGYIKYDRGLEAVASYKDEGKDATHDLFVRLFPSVGPENGSVNTMGTGALSNDSNQIAGIVAGLFRIISEVRSGNGSDIVDCAAITKMRKNKNREILVIRNEKKQISNELRNILSSTSRLFNPLLKKKGLSEKEQEKAMANFTKCFRNSDNTSLKKLLMKQMGPDTNEQMLYFF